MIFFMNDFAVGAIFVIIMCRQWNSQKVNNWVTAVNETYSHNTGGMRWVKYICGRFCEEDKVEEADDADEGGAGVVNEIQTRSIDPAHRAFVVDEFKKVHVIQYALFSYTVFGQKFKMNWCGQFVDRGHGYAILW